MDFAPELLVRQVLGQGVAEGLSGDVVVHNYTKMPIDLKPGQAQIHGWGPGEQPIYRVKGHDGKEVITSNKRKMIQIAREQGVAEAQLDEKCWDGYQQQGMKNKGGRQVPNCVPTESVAEGAMPASVIRVKEKIRQMSDAEKKEYFQGKTREQLQQLARSHGYGENSNVYAKYAAQGVNEGAEQEILFYAKIPDGSRVYARVKDEEQIARLQQQYRAAEIKTFDFRRPDILDWLEARGINLRKFAPGMVQTMYPGSRGHNESKGLNEFAPGSGGDDDAGDDPYKYPKPESYRRSADYFGQFEADHFDREDFDDATGVFKGYWGGKQIAYFKFDNSARTGSDDPGRGWYYEPESDGSDNTTAAPAVDNADERKQQELSMIRQFLKSGNRPNPDSQIGQLMKKHGIEEDLSRRGFLRGAGAAAVAGAAGSAMAAPFKHSQNVDPMTDKAQGGTSTVVSDDGSGKLHIQWNSENSGVWFYLNQGLLGFSSVSSGFPLQSMRIKIGNSPVNDTVGTVSKNFKSMQIGGPDDTKQLASKILKHSGELRLEVLLANGNKKVLKFTIEPDATSRSVKEQGVAGGLNEFAMGGSDDDGSDGFSDDTLRQLAAQWYNGDEDPRVESTLMAAGWEIGQDEGYDDTPGVFVVQAGDINGNSYISWPAHELEGLDEAVDPEIEEMYEAMQQLAEEMADSKGVSVDLVWESFEALDDHMLYETAAWRRKEGKSKKGGLNAKGVASYRRENPGSKLQMAVTTKPSKLKKGSKAAKRRKSFCARMGGVKGPMKKPNGKPTRKALALRKWNC
jgi:hypothetical protein